VTGARILLIDGNVAEIRVRQVVALGYDSGNGYARVLRRIDPVLQIDIGPDGGPPVSARRGPRGLRRGHDDRIAVRSAARGAA